MGMVGFAGHARSVPEGNTVILWVIDMELTHCGFVKECVEKSSVYVGFHPTTSAQVANGRKDKIPRSMVLWKKEIFIREKWGYQKIRLETITYWSLSWRWGRYCRRRSWSSSTWRRGTWWWRGGRLRGATIIREIITETYWYTIRTTIIWTIPTWIRERNSYCRIGNKSESTKCEYK